MQLTQFTDYALRVLIYIAVQKKLCTIAEIAKVFLIPENHLVKIVHKLGQLGFIKTSRGKHGGIQLAHDPKDLNLKTLVSQLEPNFYLVGCFNQEKANCPIIPVCKLKSILGEAMLEFLTVLERYTLADIIENSQELLSKLK